MPPRARRPPPFFSRPRSSADSPTRARGQRNTAHRAGVAPPPRLRPVRRTPRSENRRIASAALLCVRPCRGFGQPDGGVALVALIERASVENGEGLALALRSQYLGDVPAPDRRARILAVGAHGADTETRQGERHNDRLEHPSPPTSCLIFLGAHAGAHRGQGIANL